MSVRQKCMAGVLAVTVVAMFGATVAKDLAARSQRPVDSIWVDPSASDQLLASRLNLTNIVKSQPAP